MVLKWPKNLLHEYFAPEISCTGDYLHKNQHQRLLAVKKAEQVKYRNEKKTYGSSGIRTHLVLDSKSRALTDCATAHQFTRSEFSSYLKCLKPRFRGFPGLISILDERGCFSSHNEPLKTHHTAPHFCQMEKTHRLL